MLAPRVVEDDSVHLRVDCAETGALHVAAGRLSPSLRDSDSKRSS